MKHQTSIRSVLLAFALAAALSLPVGAAQTLYTKTDSELVARGVTYTDTRRLTTDGYLDIHYLTIDLTQDHIQVKSVESAKEYGLKESTQELLTSNGAIAGVNGDFFGMVGTYSDPFGLVVTDGNLHSAGTDRNVEKNQYTSFFLTEEGEPFLDYFRLQVEFLNNGASHLELASMNKISEMKYPIYFDTEAGESTKAVDSRFPDLVKIIVENGYISRISNKGETVSVPQDGYLIILPGATYDAMPGIFAEGQTAELRVTTTVNLDNIETAFSGGEWILKDGNVVDVKGNTVVSTGREPRTALGISQDKNTLYLVTVDGRRLSIGATHSELAAIMKELGAYNAMNLDGGGSTTMVVKTAEEDAATVKNTLSDGSQRKVVNAVGVFDTAPVGNATQLVVKPADDRVFVGQSLAVEVFGYDAYFHKVAVSNDNLHVSASAGTFSNGTYVPDAAGVVTLKAVLGEMAATTNVTVMDPVALVPANDTISLSAGGTATITMEAIDAGGYTAPVSTGVTYTLSNPAIGTLEGNVFTATQEGNGYITCTLGSSTCTIGVSVGGKPTAVSMDREVTFSGYPANVTGSASNNGGTLTLNYQFGQSSATQAAYVLFSQPIALENGASSLSLSINGNQSGQWLRGRILDANGNTYPIDFTKNLDFSGWQTLTAAIPSEAVSPLKLDSIYVAALSNSDTGAKTLQFKDLQATVPNLPEGLPQNSGWVDPLSTDIQGKQEGNSYFTFAGNLALDLQKVEKPAEYTEARSRAFDALQSDSNLYIPLGTNDITLQGTADRLTMNSDYRVYNDRGVTMIRLNTSNGGIKSVAASQWTVMQTDALASPYPHVLFLMDVSPSNFTDQEEAKLFRDFLETLQNAGKNVFVISTNGTSLWSTAREGVRYINIPDLWQADGSLNPNAAILRFQVSGNEIRYEIEKLY